MSYFAPDPTKRDGQAGMSLVEVTIATLILPILLGAIYMSTQNMNKVQEQAGDAVTVTKKLRSSLRRMGDDLRTSSKTAEDFNTNKTLDTGEDLNGNSRLDSDWLVTTSSIKFNRMLPDGTYSLPSQYILVGTDLCLKRMVVAKGPMQSVVIASGVSNFTVSETDNQIGISVTINVPKAGGTSENVSSSISVMQRN